MALLWWVVVGRIFDFQLLYLISKTIFQFIKEQFDHMTSPPGFRLELDDFFNEID